MTSAYIDATEPTGGTGSTTFGVVLPTATYTAGDTIAVFLASGDVTHTAPSATWTEVKTYQDATFSRTSLFILEATGSESGTTVNFTGGSAAPFAAVAALIKGAAYGVVAASTGADGANAFPAPDVVTATWTGGDNLFVGVAGYVDDDATLSGFDGFYRHEFASEVSGGGTNAGAGVAVISRRLKADSDYPPEGILISESEAWTAFTVVFRAASSVLPAPVGPAGLEVQMLFRDQWVDIGEDAVYTRDPVQVRHGRSDWSSQAEPASLRMTLDNRTGAWSPDYDSGAYAGMFRRNIPIRVGLQGDTGIVNGTGTDGEYILTLHDAADVLAGDFDFRAEFTLDAPFTDGAVYALATNLDSSQNGWTVGIGPYAGGVNIRFLWNDTGGTLRQALASSGTGDGLPPWLLWKRSAIRVTLEESSGDVSFYYSTSIDGPWTLGVVDNPTGGATTIDYSTSGGTQIGRDRFAANNWPGKVYKVALLDGIAGTPVFDLDLTGATPGAASVVDDTARTWTVQPDGRLTAAEWRFHGEVASLPVDWALKGDQWARIEANGILRRLRQWDDVLQSPLRRGLTRGALSADIHSYWPMEEKGDASLNRLSNLVGVQQFVKKGGADASPASFAGFAASDAIPTLGADRWHVRVDPGSLTGEWMVRFLLSVPSDWASDVELLHIVTGDLEYRLNLDSSGDLTIKTYRDGTLVHTGTTYTFGLIGQSVRVSVGVETNGTGVDGSVLAQTPGGSILGGGNTFASSIASYPTFIRMNENADCEGLAVGHMTVESAYRDDGFSAELNAFDGETAGARIARLCSEEGIPVAVYGVSTESALLGPQGIASFLDLVQEAAATDLGVLFDSPTGLGLAYRTGASLRNQDAQFSIDYDAGDALGTPTLERDDNRFSNDVTITNYDGTEARAELAEGPYSTLEPPTGAGRYSSTFAVNIGGGAEVVQSHADARLALFSVDQPRVTGLELATHLPGVSAADRGLILGIIPGDKLGLSGLPAAAHPDDLDQLVQGWTERIEPHTHTLRVNTTPAEPWDTGLVEQAGDIRYDTAGSILANGEDAGATTLYVHTVQGQVWTTDAGDMPFDIDVDGARVTVTSISGAVSPQTFTVAAIPRGLSGGSTIKLADPAYYSL